MSPDEPFYSPKAKPLPPPFSRAGELLFKFYLERDHQFFRCELRDHWPYGVEGQFFEGGEFFLGRLIRPSLDLTRTPRAMAIQWAEAERKAIEAYR